MYPLKNNPRKHYYETRRDPVDIILLHVTAGLEDLDMQGIDHTARKTNEYGSRVETPKSWHCVVDSDSIESALPDEYTAFHVKGYNSESLGLEICNRDARWDNKPKTWVTATLRNAARKCLEWERKFKIPRVLLTKAEVDAGKRGYSYHMFLDPERRRDPGITFPIEYFFSLIAMLDSPTVRPAPPKPAKPAVKPNCTVFQRAIRTPADNKWGAKTDKHATALIEASDYGGNDFPHGIKFAQMVVGVTADGKWGPNSKLAHRSTVREAQRALATMGFSPGNADGIWGRQTQDAYDRARRACHI